MSQTTLPQAATPPTPLQPPQEEKGSGWGIGRIAGLTAAILVGIFAVIYVVGIVLAQPADGEQFRLMVETLRDSVLIFMLVEGIVIIFTIAVLVVQIARLVNLLQTETRPILHNADSAAKSVKGTAEFVGNNVAGPIIKATGFFAGLGVLLRELGGIRRAIRRSKQGEQHDT
jgi:uncharacterized membrane protein